MKFKKIDLSEEEKRAINTNYHINEGFITNEIISNCFYGLLYQMIENYKADTENTEIIIPYIGKVKVTIKDNELLYSFLPAKEIKNILNDIMSGETSILEKSVYQDINNLFNKITNKQ